MSSVQVSSAVAVTQGPLHHWCGYHDVTPWDASGRWLLAAEASFQTRLPGPGELCRLGVVDLRRNGSFEAFAETAAWNWQGGARLQWRGPRYTDEVVYNTQEGDQLAAVVHNLKQERRRVLPAPVYALAPDGRVALTMSFARLEACHPGMGYGGAADPYGQDLAPDADGLWSLDLESGARQLLVSLEALTDHEPHRTMKGAKHWVSDPQFSPDGSRFLFLHRWVEPTRRLRWHRMLTAQADGSDLMVVCDYQMVSHFDWYDNDRVLTWARQLDLGDHFYLFHVTSGMREVIGFSTLTEDGHCSFSPDRRWILTDTYPDENNERCLVLYRPADDELVELGRFYADPNINGEFRCDLHPRWSRDGRNVCFDSIHEGSRQIYLMDVGRTVNRR